MAAIVRVKRRRDEDPADSLVFSCKKTKTSKTDENQSTLQANQIKSVFKFATTVPVNEVGVSKHIKDAIRKEKLQKELKNHGASYGETIQTKSRNAKKKSSSSNRYKIVSEKRSIDLASLDCDGRVTPAVNEVPSEGAASAPTSSGRLAGDNKIFCLYDVVGDVGENRPGSTAHRMVATPEPTHASAITCNNIPMVRQTLAPPNQTENDYVYDLYYMNKQDFDFRAFETILAIEAFTSDQEFLDERGFVEEECYDDEDDSNDESNWRNDYPDEDPRFFDDCDDVDDEDDYVRGFESEDEEEIQSRFDRLGIGKDDLSSDDEGNEGNGVWVPKGSYEEYKKRVTKELNGE